MNSSLAASTNTTGKRKTPSSRNVTLKDVAARAGVGPMSVSVVINGTQSPTRVSDATRQRILEAASELGYRPNLMARNVRSGKSHQVGILVRNTARVSPAEIGSHPLVWDFILGINSGLEAAGYMVSLVRLSDIDPEKHVQNSPFSGHLLDGLIVVNDVWADDPSHIESLVPTCVWLDASVWHDEGCIRRDEYAAGRIVGREMQALGYSNWIGLRRPPGPTSVASQTSTSAKAEHFSFSHRWAGIEAAAQESGASLKSFEVEWGDYQALHELLPLLTPQTALIATDIYQVFALQQVLLESDLMPGRDFALACCDDGYQSADIQWDALSRVQFDRYILGQQAAELLLRRLETPDSPCPSIQAVPEWIKGRTACPCPADG